MVEALGHTQLMAARGRIRVLRGAAKLYLQRPRHPSRLATRCIWISPPTIKRARSVGRGARRPVLYATPHQMTKYVGMRDPRQRFASAPFCARPARYIAVVGTSEERYRDLPERPTADDRRSRGPALAREARRCLGVSGCDGRQPLTASRRLGTSAGHLGGHTDRKAIRGSTSRCHRLGELRNGRNRQVRDGLLAIGGTAGDGQRIAMAMRTARRWWRSRDDAPRRRCIHTRGVPDAVMSCWALLLRGGQDRRPADTI